MKESIKNTRDTKEDVKLFLWITLTIIPAVYFFFVIESSFWGYRIHKDVFYDYADLLAMTFCLFLCLTLTYVAVKKNKMKVISRIIALILITVMIPEVIYSSVAGDNGKIIWFLAGVLYIVIMLEGKRRILYLLINAVWAAIYFYMAYQHESIEDHISREVLFINSYFILCIVCLMVVLMVTYEIRLQKETLQQVEKQKEEIDALNKSQNRFFSSMSHEIRTPINTIIGLNEMILREDASEEINENAANIQSASRMLLHLINDILDMSKFESGEMQLTIAPYHTGSMLSDIVNMLWLRAREKGLAFHISVSPDMPEELLGDEVRIKQILINVLNNAIKYTNEGSVTLNIQCDMKDEKNANIIYSVTDTGMGIKKESIPYLFTAFRRVDEERNRFIEGTGLGLSIVKQFVDLMGGKITVNSIYTKGSTFIIEIPQQIVSANPLGEINMETRHTQTTMVKYQKRFEAPEAKVLIVDDTKANLLVASKLLRGTKAQVVCAQSGAEALEKTMETAFHVIFMDHMMPQMDGIECMHRIHSQTGGLCKDAKIVALTANVGSESAALYAKEGFDGYLVKPVTGEQFESELLRQLPRELVILTGSDDDILEESLSWSASRQKKAAVVVTTESVADLPKELLEKYKIAIIPHMVQTENGVFRDGLEIEQQGLLAYMRKNMGRVDTVAPDVAFHETFFASQLAHANNIIHISISSKVATSGCHAAMEAAGAFDNVFVVDTGHLSSGQGLIALWAAKLAQEGKSAEEIVSILEQMKTRIHTSFIVDNLDYLARAHQVEKRIASITRAFLIHPVLILRKGEIKVGKVFFGSRELAWKKYISRALDVMGIDQSILFVTYVGLSQSDLTKIKAEIDRRMTFEKIYFQKASPAIAVNCGPGTFGLLFRVK